MMKAVFRHPCDPFGAVQDGLAGMNHPEFEFFRPPSIFVFVIASMQRKYSTIAIVSV
jgi:hypothetical protein